MVLYFGLLQTSLMFALVQIQLFKVPSNLTTYYLLDVVTSSGILKAKQKLGVTFDSDKLRNTYFTKILKLTMCSA